MAAPLPGFLHYRADVPTATTPTWTPRWYAWLMFSLSTKVDRVRVVTSPGGRFAIFVSGASLTSAIVTTMNTSLQSQKAPADVCTLTMGT